LRIIVKGYRRNTAAFPDFSNSLARRGVQGVKGCVFVSSTKTWLM
jgi:hypothetical protein